MARWHIAAINRTRILDSRSIQVVHAHGSLSLSCKIRLYRETEMPSCRQGNLRLTKKTGISVYHGGCGELLKWEITRADWAAWMPGTCQVDRLARRPGGPPRQMLQDGLERGTGPGDPWLEREGFLWMNYVQGPPSYATAHWAGLPN